MAPETQVGTPNVGQLQVVILDAEAATPGLVEGGHEFGMNLNVSDSVPNGSKAGELSSMVSNNPERKGNDASFRGIWGTLTLAN